MPYILTLFGPVGHIDDGIVIATRTRKNRESQIVAHLQQETHTTPLCYHTAIAWHVILGFAGKRKQMALVVILVLAIGANKIQTVTQLSSVILSSHTSYNGSIIQKPLGPHPLQNIITRIIRASYTALGHKACGKGFRQHKHISIRMLIYQRFKMLQILRKIVATYIVLYNGYLHNLYTLLI